MPFSLRGDEEEEEFLPVRDNASTGYSVNLVEGGSSFCSGPWHCLRIRSNHYESRKSRAAFHPCSLHTNGKHARTAQRGTVKYLHALNAGFEWQGIRSFRISPRRSLVREMEILEDDGSIVFVEHRSILYRAKEG